MFALGDTYTKKHETKYKKPTIAGVYFVTFSVMPSQENEII